jgi:hypothetical protein
VSGRWKVLDRFVSVVCWFVLLCILLAVVAMAHGFVVGSAGPHVSFSLGNLWIQYEMRSGGLWAERLIHAVVTQGFPKHQMYHTSTNTYGLGLAHGAATFRPERGETVWVDEQGRVTHLGRVLHPEDMEALEKLRAQQDLDGSEGPSISSPEEFLALVAGLSHQNGGLTPFDRAAER